MSWRFRGGATVLSSSHDVATVGNYLHTTGAARVEVTLTLCAKGGLVEATGFILGHHEDVPSSGWTRMSPVVCEGSQSSNASSVLK